MKIYSSILLLILFLFLACKDKGNTMAVETVTKKQKPEAPFVWEAANLYFLLTDRFNNGDSANDINFERTKETAVLRGFEGGDLEGITQKIEEGYFTKLGINAIWMTPVVEQVHGDVNEGSGRTYGFHGYWTKDWTQLDPNFGTAANLKDLVKTAHKKGIRIVLDAVINHTGPVTEKDEVWPVEWVRETPTCDFDSYERNIKCALVKNLPDIKTESNQEVSLPKALIQKWKKEGRYGQEMQELVDFFARTGYPRAPRFYIMKWLTDYITDFGIDGYRCDTVKHTEETVWKEFKTECEYAFSQWKATHPDEVLDANDFYMLGEVYNYTANNPRAFDFGDKKVDYLDYGFDSMINFGFKYDAKLGYEELFSKYANVMQGTLKGYGILNYMSSHDDGNPFDKERTKAFETATKLLLCPGTSQVYYGDESARPLLIDGTVGDATLRSFMNWDAIAKDSITQKIHAHWQNLGQFRVNHPAVGAGIHQMISETPYVFKRIYTNGDFKDQVVVGLDLPEGEKTIGTDAVFENGTTVKDAYSGTEAVVKDGKVTLNTSYHVVLLERL